jgi:hypothetical protein
MRARPRAHLCRCAAILNIDPGYAGDWGVRGARTDVLRRSAHRLRPRWLTMDRPKDKTSARDLLLDWGRAPGYSQRAAEFLELARRAPLRHVRKRYLTIAEHYRTLAETEKRVQIKKSRTTPIPHLK